MSKQPNEVESQKTPIGGIRLNAPVGKILVVDDEPKLRSVLVEALQMHGYEAIGCASGKEALAKLEIKDFDLLLTDLMMPEMDGVALLKAALEVDPFLVGIILTGQGTIQTAVDAMQTGAFDYVLKPFRLQNLLPVLTRALNTRQLRLENLQLRETVAIHELSQTIAFTLDPQTVMSKLTEAALKQTDADEASVLLPTSDGKEFYVAAARGDYQERLLGERIPFARSIASWVARERTPLILNGEVKDERFVALWPRPDIRSSVSVPMVVANKLIGVLNLNVINRSRPFALGQMKALSILAGTAAAALESASLYMQVRATEEKYRSIFENSIEGLFQTSAEGRLLTANPALARIFGYRSPEEMTETISDIANQLYVNPVDRAEVTALQQERGTLTGWEIENYRKDGEKIWISLNQRSVSNEAGELLYFEGSIQDITERKQAERLEAELNAEIREHRERLDTIVGTVPGIVFESWGKPDVDVLEPRADFVSEYIETMLGYTVAEWSATPRFWLTAVHPDDRERVAREAEAQFSSGFKAESEFRWIGKDQRVVWVRAHTIIIRDEAGKSIGVRGVVTDITAAKAAEQALQETVRSKDETLALLDTLLSTAPIGFAFLDSNLVYQRINESLAAINGLPVADHLGKTLREVSPEMALVFEPLLQQVLDTGEAILDLEIAGDPKLHPGFPLQHLLVSFYPVRMQEGEMLGAGVLVSDITERKRAEKEKARLTTEIENQKQRLDNIVASVPGVVWEAWGEPDAANQRIDFVSDYVEEMLGYKVDEWISTPNFWLTVVHPDDKAQAARISGDAFKRGENCNQEFRWLAKDGHEVWVESNFVVVFDDHGQPSGIRGVNTSIGKRKAAEKALKRSEGQLAEAQRQAHIGSWNWDLLQNVLTWSDEHYRIFGVERDQFDVGFDDSVMALIHPDDREFVRRQVKQTIERTQPFNYYFRIVRPDGEERIIDSSGSVECDEHGTAIRMFGTAQDVTERERIVQALRQSEERYRDLVEKADDLIYEHDLQGNYTASNKAGERITGYSLEESLKLNLMHTVAPEYLDIAKEMLRRKLAGESVTAYELVVIAKDGHRVPVEVSTRLVMRDGVPVGVQGIARDITERKRVEEVRSHRATHALFRADVSAAVATSQAPLKSTLQSCVQAMVAHLDAAFARIWTLNREDGMLELQASAGIYTHLDGPHARVPLGSFKIGLIAEERLPHISNNVQNDDRVNDHEWAKREGMVAFAGYPLMVEDRVLGVMAMFARKELAEDTLDALAAVADLVSQGVERKRAEVALGESEERYRQLFESNPQPMWVYDVETLAFLAVNESAVQQYGYSLEEFLGMTILDIRPQEEIPAMQSAMANYDPGADKAGYWTHIKKNRIQIKVEITSHSIFFDGRRAKLILANDITERLRLEAALLSSEEQLRQSQKLEAIGQLAGGVAHDFNNLLTAINGYSALALRRIGEDHPISPYLMEIKKAGDRAANLTRQLLAFGRKQLLQPLPLNLNDNINDMTKLLKRLIGEHVQLLTKLNPQLKLTKADPGQIEQVLVNLVVNARDAMVRGGVITIETSNAVLDGQYVTKHVGILPGHYVLLSVSDTGKGMDQETQSHIFEPFFTTKEKGKGTGLGLSTVYGIVKQSGGTLWVYSEPNKGTTFKIYLPQMVSESVAPLLTLAEPTIRRGSETILLVEDEDMVRNLTTELLEGHGYTVLKADGGEEALRVSGGHKGPIQLLLTDVVMPEMSGRDVAEQLKRSHPETKVLFMSGYTDDAIVHHGIVDSNIAFIQKPFSESGLAQKVREVLESENQGA